MAERLWPDGPVFQQTEQVRITADSLLLADFACVKAGERGADLGCSSGLLMLLLLWREPKLRMTGLELQPEAAALGGKNLIRNNLDNRAEILPGDLRETGKNLPNGGFDFVISNPPYFRTEQGIPSPIRDRAAARGETDMSMRDLCRIAGRLCRSGGRAYVSYRPERLGMVLDEMRLARLEPKRLRFVHHNAVSSAFAVLVEGRKDGHPGILVEPPVLIRNSDGTETMEYLRICHRS